MLNLSGSGRAHAEKTYKGARRKDAHGREQSEMVASGSGHGHGLPGDCLLPNHLGFDCSVRLGSRRRVKHWLTGLHFVHLLVDLGERLEGGRRGALGLGAGRLRAKGWPA